VHVLITGGAGFIGCNAAKRFLDLGYRVTVLDNLSRRGASANLEWLKSCGLHEFISCDVRDAGRLSEAVRRCRGLSAVLHLAAQVAVTTSVNYPREDFEINALGTFNLLEAVRAAGGRPLVIYASTNKVYGGMEDVEIETAPGICKDEREGRYSYKGLAGGCPESQLLDFHSPYGCSKGAGDQYVRDYARIYGLPSVVFRQSCIYGPRQFGIEDQGWVAWFVISAVLGRPVRIYGNGKQVRDLLYVEDLVDAYQKAIEEPKKVSGKIYNIGGGPIRSRSILSLVRFLERHLGISIPVSFHDCRPGDQPVYVSDISKAKREMGWIPKTTVESGAAQLVSWVKANRDLVTRELSSLWTAQEN
jgi:CDP-paratose 2-epimerase